MNCRVLRAVLVTAFTGIFLPVLGQKNYYVVVGAFSTEGSAKEFTAHLPSMNADTAYAMHENNGMLHLYVLKTTDEGLAIAKSMELQKNLDEGGGGTSGNYESLAINNRPEGKVITYKKGLEAGEPASARASAPAEGIVAAPPMNVKGKLFKFTILDERGKPLPGNVHHVDFENERDVASYTASAYTDILNPGKNSEMSLVCGVFGYKFTEKYLNYASPANTEGAYQDENGAWVIPYALERLEKGDVSVMYNVGFHKDAVVMLPDSQSDLDELVKMMTENPNYQITVHGHCNGKKDRKIITPVGASGDIFDLTQSQQVYGSAKLLSSLRAEAVRQYLINHGIEAKRIKTFAWGGRYMLVDEDSSVAKLNDRIEIEIRND